MKKLIFIILVSILMVGCTKNARTKFIGGYQRIDLPQNQKLINVTWKNNNLWILTEEMDSTYTPKMKRFIEKSSWGAFEGEIVFYEHRN